MESRTHASDTVSASHDPASLETLIHDLIGFSTRLTTFRIAFGQLDHTLNNRESRTHRIGSASGQNEKLARQLSSYRDRLDVFRNDGQALRAAQQVSTIIDALESACPTNKFLWGPDFEPGSMSNWQRQNAQYLDVIVACRRTLTEFLAGIWSPATQAASAGKNGISSVGIGSAKETPTPPPEWIIDLFSQKQYELLKALWGKGFVSEDDLIINLDYGKSLNPKDSLRRRVSEATKNLCARKPEIGEMWTIQQRTRDKIKSYALLRQK
ncbi:MAG: hypothetical protein K8T89_22080 [Planctomycetes bacterium]|nr:hypothetical protein [Planctomycetota bacterium]